MFMPGIGHAVDFFDMVSQTDWTRSLYRSLIHWVRLPIDGEAIDVGCGAGGLVNLLAQRVRHVTGLDSSLEMLQRALAYTQDYRLNNVSYVHGRVQSLPIPDASYDLVTCVNLLFLFDDPHTPMQELIRICKPDGQVVVVGPSDEMNPWSAQRYCEAHKLEDFNRDSFLSWSTAAARRKMLGLCELQKLASECGGSFTEWTPLLDGLAFMARIVPVQQEWNPVGFEPLEGEYAQSLFRD
ncbi:MAG: class I SAM-dependent methyltransferase [Alicyclobacillus sp.]|nr:class I SAM-dependent methyltransferase [Alicyclobacillus sp.]